MLLIKLMQKPANENQEVKVEILSEEPLSLIEQLNFEKHQVFSCFLY